MNLNEEVQFSFMVGFPNSATANAVVELAEQLKFDSHRVGEHVAFPVPILDPLLQLSLASAFSDNLTFCGVDVQERGARLSAAISALKQLWKNEEVCYQSKFYQLVSGSKRSFFT